MANTEKNVEIFSCVPLKTEYVSSDHLAFEENGTTTDREKENYVLWCFQFSDQNCTFKSLLLEKQMGFGSDKVVRSLV